MRTKIFNGGGMYIERKEYLDRLIDHRWNGQIKVITGLRRSGKSFLLFTIFRNHLIAEGVREENIISIALDTLENEAYRNPYALNDYLKARIADKHQEYYVLIDEVQYAISRKELMDRDNPPRLYGVLNVLLAMGNADVYVTGSNSKLLSSDVMTEFRGRGDEIRVYPLSFSEYLPVSGKDKEEAFNDYMLYGGLPLAVQKKTFEEKASYLDKLFRAIYFKDIEERNGIQQPEILSQLTDGLCSTAGSLTNIAKLTNSINSIKKTKKDNAVSENTVRKYVSLLEDAFLFSCSRRYDIRGKAYFESQSKYYPTDTGLRNARLGFRQVEASHLMENIIYNHLIQKGYLVDVGVIERNATDSDGRRHRIQHEIDFVVSKGMFQYYIQSAFSMEDASKEEKELYPLSITGNSFRKIVITRHELIPHYDSSGILHVGVTDFILGDYLSERI